MVNFITNKVSRNGLTVDFCGGKLKDKDGTVYEWFKEKGNYFVRTRIGDATPDWQKTDLAGYVEYIYAAMDEYKGENHEHNRGNADKAEGEH